VSETEPEITEEQVAELDAEEPAPVVHAGLIIEDEPAEEAEPVDEEVVNAQAQIVKMDAYADRVGKYLARNMDELLGEEAQHYVECPFCTFWQTPGWMPIRPCPPELVGTVYEYLGTMSPTEYAEDKHSETCSDCNGQGQVATGSKVPGQEKLVCVRCKGAGWVATDAERQGGSFYMPNGPHMSAPPPSETSAPMFAPSEDEPQEVTDLKQRGYVIIPPMVQS
jgi:hypothetical protein